MRLVPRAAPVAEAAALLLIALVLPAVASAQTPLRRQAIPRISLNLLAPATGGLARTVVREDAPQQPVYVLAEPGWGTGFGVEPGVANLTFSHEMRLNDETMYGGLAGVYFGRSMRIRGYYWRGYNASEKTSSPIQMYGGEVQFALGSGWIVHPFVLGGYGRVDYMNGYVDQDSLPREDQNNAILGGGLNFRILNWLEISAAYRDFIMKSPIRDKQIHNGLWTTGISFRFGGTPKKAQPMTYGAAAAGGVAAGGAAAPGNVATFPVPVNGGEIKVVYNGDTLRVKDSAQASRALATGTVTIEAVRDLVSAELAYLNALYPVPFGTRRTALTAEQVDSLTRRIGLRANGVFDYVITGQAEAMHQAMKSELTARGVDEAAQARVLARVDSALTERLRLNAAQSRAIMIRDDSAYARRAREEAEADKRTISAGIGGFSEFYLDGRISFRSGWTRNLRLAPEAAVGFFGGGVSALVAGNALYYFSAGSTRPYGGLGLGLLVRGAEIGGETGTSFVVNPIFGVEFNSASAARAFGRRALGYFAELQGVDLFNNTRLVAGITWKF